MDTVKQAYTLTKCVRTGFSIFDPNERANVRNVVVGMLGSACAFIYRQIRPVRSPVLGCEKHDRDEMNERPRDVFPLTEVNTTNRIALKIVGVPVAKTICKVHFRVTVSYNRNF